MFEGLFPFSFTTRALLNLCLFIRGAGEKGFVFSNNFSLMIMSGL